MTINQYSVWRRSLADTIVKDWIRTAHIISARTDKEAQGKMRRMFAHAGFHSMSLVAVLRGMSPSMKDRR